MGLAFLISWATVHTEVRRARRVPRTRSTYEHARGVRGVGCRTPEGSCVVKGAWCTGWRLAMHKAGWRMKGLAMHKGIGSMLDTATKAALARIYT